MIRLERAASDYSHSSSDCDNDRGSVLYSYLRGKISLKTERKLLIFFLHKNKNAKRKL